jgi:hypothetical protein
MKEEVREDILDARELKIILILKHKLELFNFKRCLGIIRMILKCISGAV